MSIPDIVQVLFHGRKSGKLVLRAGNEEGEVHFLDGAVADAAFSGAKGAEAFYLLLKLTDGDFALDPTFVPPAKVIQESSEGLLLEGAASPGSVTRSAGAPPLRTEVAEAPLGMTVWRGDSPRCAISTQGDAMASRRCTLRVAYNFYKFATIDLGSSLRVLMFNACSLLLASAFFSSSLVLARQPTLACRRNRASVRPAR